MARRLACIAALLLFPFCTARAQGVCPPSSLGHPCSPGGVASQAGDEPALNPGAGNPIHLATGNKHQRDVDLPASPTSPLLVLERHYNSLDPRVSALGRGWTLAYDTRLYSVAGRVQVVQADGSRVVFGQTDGMPLRTRHGILSRDGAQWVWTWPTGHSLRFDGEGRLVRVSAAPPSGASLDILRHAGPGPLRGAIAQVMAQDGAALRFGYRVSGKQAYIQHADSPLGRFQYEYDETAGAARLAAVIRPDGMRRRYLYEPVRQSGNAFHLTGIEIVSADGRHKLRTHTWAYDARGRAVMFAAGEPDAQKGRIHVEYHGMPAPGRDGLTIITTPDGRQTRMHMGVRAGRHVLLRASGAPCAGCAAPGSLADYDDAGRLASINGVGLQRDASGRIRAVTPAASGWPGLALGYDTAGRRSWWTSRLTGTERMQFDARGRPARRIFANGDQWEYQYDAAGRPARLVASNAHAVTQTRLAWRGGLLSAVRHPHENETRRYDAQGRLIQRRVTRPGTADMPAYSHVERFEYDDRHRLAVHHLPEGGALLYQWGRGDALLRVDWRDARGVVHNVVQGAPPLAGYRYGNGLWLHTVRRRGHAGILALRDGAAHVWLQFVDYDAQGRVRREAHFMPALHRRQDWRYAYDGQSRMGVAAPEPGPAVSERAANERPDAEAPDTQRPALQWHAWSADGAAAALRTRGRDLRPEARRDASGLPVSFQGWRLSYGPDRRLQRAARQGAAASYRHNAFGHRISAHTPTEDILYFHLGNRLVAESRRPRGVARRARAPGITRRYVYAHHAPVGMIDYTQDGGTLYAIHADLIGAPRMVTDDSRRLRWAAAYSPTGKAVQVAGDLALDLRLPGQVLDATTGWHDNLLRTYSPDFGQYLEPDPLGPLPGGQALGYAGQQPRRYADPLGLLLFAFDGTRQNAATGSNIWKLSQRYQDGQVFYRTGPGNPYFADWDAVVAHTASAIVEAQWQSLLDELGGAFPSAAQTIPVDIIGYSRGAALARHFGNLIARQTDQGLFSYTDAQRGLVTACIDLRFMGLFDTVAQFGLNGALNDQFDLGISAAWAWVAHAVALQERRWLFPLVAAADAGQANVVEAPFIGAHADIGGGVFPGEPGSGDPGDLSDVALNWMLWQARAASLRFSAGDPQQGVVTRPVLHDQRAALARSVQDGDRRVDGSDGAKLLDYQDDHARLGREQREATEALIRRYDDWRSSESNEVGMVDMEAYARWLRDELGWLAPPA